MNKIEILLLKILKHDGCKSSIYSYSAKDIECMENIGIQYGTVYKYLKGLVIKGYAANGLLDGRYKTFYITDDGIKKLEEYENE